MRLGKVDFRARREAVAIQNNLISLVKKLPRRKAVTLKVVKRNGSEGYRVSEIPVDVGVVEEVRVVLLFRCEICVNVFDSHLTVPG